MLWVKVAICISKTTAGGWAAAMVVDSEGLMPCDSVGRRVVGKCWSGDGVKQMERDIVGMEPFSHSPLLPPFPLLIPLSILI